MRIRAFRRAIALGAVLTLALAACGGDDDDDDAARRTRRRRPTATSGRQRRPEPRSRSTTSARRRRTTASRHPTASTSASSPTSAASTTARSTSSPTTRWIAAEECFGFETELHRDHVRGRLRDQHRDDRSRATPNVVITIGFLIHRRDSAAATGEPRRELHRHRPVPGRVPDELRRHPVPRGPGRLPRRRRWPRSLSESGVVGVVGGREDVPPVVRFVNALRARVRSRSTPTSACCRVYNESFTDPNKGASDAQQFIGEGADVIFGAGGQTGSGGVTAAAEAGHVGHRRRPGRVLHDVQRRRRRRVGVPRDLGRSSASTSRCSATSSRRSTARSRAASTRSTPPTTASPTRRSTTPTSPTTSRRRSRRRRAGLADGSIDTGVDPVTGLPN